MRAVYLSFEFYIANSTAFIFNSTTGIDLHVSVTSKGLQKTRNPESRILDLKS